MCEEGGVSEEVDLEFAAVAESVFEVFEPLLSRPPVRSWLCIPCINAAAPSPNTIIRQCKRSGIELEGAVDEDEADSFVPFL